MSLALSEEVSAYSMVMSRHGVRASLYTSWTMGNSRQRIFRCGYWEWYDPPCFGYKKEILTFLLRQRNSLK
ncbi:hypothetical protein P3X46_010572 [Hevea brasiliensis]|uniref:Uncharacterized protein n=1 Tax=Hevea brasiliensis TaxID=3981 RepID=A0ABQ9MEG1_HEVBR|nr:hypothetical protein P3X46_010572 [Hevea brasiliensis]